MSDSLQVCYECGSQGPAEEFLQRVQEQQKSGKGKLYRKAWFCPACVARYDAAPAPKVGGRCDKCGGTIKPGEGQLRFRTEAENLGLPRWHHNVNMVLCPECAASYDGAGSHLIKGMMIVVGALVLLACAGLVCAPR